MRQWQTLLAGLVAVAATAALAHQGVKNPAVKARMDAMSAIGENTKVLGTMAKGEVPFDAGRAREAALAIAEHAARTPRLFEARETDPVSEALPAIWDDFADFTARAEAMETAARGAAERISDPEDLRPALAGIGQTCKSCHGAYRE